MKKSPSEKQLVRAMRREPGFLDLICAAIERQQKSVPHGPAELRAAVLAKQKAKQP